MIHGENGNGKKATEKSATKNSANGKMGTINWAMGKMEKWAKAERSTGKLGNEKMGHSKR